MLAGSTWTDIATIASPILAAASAATTVIVYVALTRERVQRLTEHEARIDAKIDQALDQFREATATMKLLGMQQTHLGEDGEDLKEDLKAATSELHAVIVAIKSGAAEQNVVNRVTAELLKSLTSKLEGLEHGLNDANGSVSLITEFLKSKGIMS